MKQLAMREGGRLAGRTIAILMESDYVEPELHYYLRRFAEEGARTLLATRLWGQSELTFHGHEYRAPFTVESDLAEVEANLRSLDALIVPSGMVSDRLRYTEDVAEIAPAVELLRAAFDVPTVLKGIICHGMWLAAPIPQVVAGRRVTCHNNLIGDVKNMGATYVDQDVAVDGDLVTARSADHCHLFARMIIDLLAGASPQDGKPAQVGTSTPGFTFSDLVAGYVEGYDPRQRRVQVRTGGGQTVRIDLDANTSAEMLRNLGDPYVDASGHLDDLLVPGRHLFAHGVYYPDQGFDVLAAKQLVLTGQQPGDYAFAEPGWWVHQIGELARFYRRAQFGTSKPVDYRDYRTYLRLGGDKSDTYIQETDTISRLVYGMASAFMLTGDEDFLHVAEQGTEYLRAHMRFVDRDEDVVYWYHGVDVRGGTEHKLFTSEFGDDYHAIPMYEQIYALAGPTQLYRITGDPRIASDTDATLRLIHRFFRDEDAGGYFSHVDPITLSPHHPSLGPNQSRKNWNSVGDHAPAYLFNLYLATGDERHLQMLEETFDLIVQHFPRPDSPFVQERFHTDWSADQTWGWQQNRAVVGHNLKIAWNLTRMRGLCDKPAYRELAEKLGQAMPPLGSDQRRGGWYDVVERTLASGQRSHRYAWHDRKAWWQQEQAILAYQILAGNGGDAEFLRQAREAAAFYNAFFLDHDEGGVYFNVLADGYPYLLGNERLKGNHSMSMYHSAELCYLACVYERLLLGNEPLTLWFRPRPDGFADRILRVAPDALPPERARLDWVEIDGRPHSAFDAGAMTVKLPDSEAPLTVKVHLSPTGQR